MADETAVPKTRRRQLARRLRDLRKESGYTLEQAAERSSLSAATISRIETGKQVILPRSVRLLCQAYGVGQPDLDHLVRLAEESEEPGWIVEYAPTVPNWFSRYVGEEADASEIRTYQPSVVPGLLQTEDYTRAVMRAARPDVDEESLDSSLGLRRRRQERLNSDAPPQVLAVIDESVVRRPVGGRRVMADQLLHLVELGKRPNITIQILPFGVGEHPAMISPFNELHFSGELGDPTIYLEVYNGAVYPDGPDDKAHFAWMWVRLRELALSPEDSSSLLTRLVAELQNPGE